VRVCILGIGWGLEKEDITDNFVVPVNVLTQSTALRGVGTENALPSDTHTRHTNRQNLGATLTNTDCPDETVSMWTFSISGPGGGTGKQSVWIGRLLLGFVVSRISYWFQMMTKQNTVEVWKMTLLVISASALNVAHQIWPESHVRLHSIASKWGSKQQLGECLTMKFAHCIMRVRPADKTIQNKTNLPLGLPLCFLLQGAVFAGLCRVNCTVHNKQMLADMRVAKNEHLLECLETSLRSLHHPRSIVRVSCTQAKCP